ncbi:hypothetical protein GQ42DRAFT_160811, partial [Ramicandelaber brevisporus]
MSSPPKCVIVLADGTADRPLLAGQTVACQILVTLPATTARDLEDTEAAQRVFEQLSVRVRVTPTDTSKGDSVDATKTAISRDKSLLSLPSTSTAQHRSASTELPPRKPSILARSVSHFEQNVNQLPADGMSAAAADSGTFEVELQRSDRVSVDRLSSEWTCAYSGNIDLSKCEPLTTDYVAIEASVYVSDQNEQIVPGNPRGTILDWYAIYASSVSKPSAGEGERKPSILQPAICTNAITMNVERPLSISNTVRRQQQQHTGNMSFIQLSLSSERGPVQLGVIEADKRYISPVSPLQFPIRLKQDDEFSLVFSCHQAASKLLCIPIRIQLRRNDTECNVIHHVHLVDLSASLGQILHPLPAANDGLSSVPVSVPAPMPAPSQQHQPPPPRFESLSAAMSPLSTRSAGRGISIDIARRPSDNRPIAHGRAATALNIPIIAQSSVSSPQFTVTSPISPSHAGLSAQPLSRHSLTVPQQQQQRQQQQQYQHQPPQTAAPIDTGSIDVEIRVDSQQQKSLKPFTVNLVASNRTQYDRHLVLDFSCDSTTGIVALESHLDIGTIKANEARGVTFEAMATIPSGIARLGDIRLSQVNGTDSTEISWTLHETAVFSI